MRGYRAYPVSRSNVSKLNYQERTRVAEMPGYPTKKLVFGRPETRTNALIFTTSLRLSGHHRGRLPPPPRRRIPWIYTMALNGWQCYQDIECP